MIRLLQYQYFLLMNSLKPKKSDWLFESIIYNSYSMYFHKISRWIFTENPVRCVTLALVDVKQFGFI